MVQMSLDAIFTALTCLSSSEYAFRPLYINSRIPVQADNFSINCQFQALDVLNEKIASQEGEMLKLQREMNIFKSILRNLENSTNLIPSSCENQRSGITQLKIGKIIDPFYVVCEENLLNGNWLVFAQRFDGTVDFNRPWKDYKVGFGNLEGEFFLGLDRVHAITNGELQELLIVLENVGKEKRIAHYEKFSIESEAENYRINLLGKYDGDAGDALRFHAGSKFSTYDQDNDGHPQNCATKHSGAWWYANCMESNLFGIFQRFGEPDMKELKGILWKGFSNGPNGSLKKIKMLLRPHRP